MKKYDFIIVGSGIIGLTIAHQLKKRHQGTSILIIDKEVHEAVHASSRNSGVLHAGFYYTADSLKAKYTVDGNKAMKSFCREHGLPLNECGKLVVASDENELHMLSELEQRGQANGSTVSLISESEAKEIEPNVKTFKKALHSPNTASVDPKAICRKLVQLLSQDGCEFHFNTKYISCKGGALQTTTGDYPFQHLVNCAGLYADKIAHDFGFGRQYTILPFKGLYLKYTKNSTDVKTNIYPVPDLNNPFLGVHFTKTFDEGIKIGPTAIPAYWRENYSGITNFNLSEFSQIISREISLFCTNSFHFRDLSLEEMRKYNRDYFIGLASKMVQHIDPKGFTEFTQPGIRAQLLNTSNNQLLQDFVAEGDSRSTHILNAVSPAFTCAFPLADHIISSHLNA